MRSLFEDQAGAAYLETLIVVGTLLIPLWIALAFVHDVGAAEAAVGNQARTAAMRQAMAAEGCGGACDVESLPIAVSGTAAGLDRFAPVAGDLRFASCRDDREVTSVRGGSRTVEARRSYACAEPEVELPAIADLACTFAAGSDLCD